MQDLDLNDAGFTGALDVDRTAGGIVLRRLPDWTRERTFALALHGFLDNVRDGHPTPPIAVVTPIRCPCAEDHPGPTVMAADGTHVGVSRPAELATGALSLSRIRELIADVVAARQQAGDANLHLLDGPSLFAPGDVADLPDLLHPNAAGYRQMGERFHQQAFAPRGPVAP